MNKMILSLLCLYTCHCLQAQTAIQKKKDFSIGETVEFKSTVLNENRTINVYLPISYQTDSLKKYPVIYLLDGSADEDFIHIAGLVQFGSFSWINFIPETIVVGIANVDRKRDFTYPTKNEEDKKVFPTTGSSENFINFIELELQPFIKHHYRTNAIRTIIGQSLGGLLATEVLFKKPYLFDNYLIISPSLWWDDESLLKYEPKAYATAKTIYIAVGKEGDIMERVAKELYEKLVPLRPEKTELFFEFFERQNHGDTLHIAIYDAFQQVFKTKK